MNLTVGSLFTLAAHVRLFGDVKWAAPAPGHLRPYVDTTALSAMGSGTSIATERHEFVDSDGFTVKRTKEHTMYTLVPTDPTEVWTVTSAKMGGGGTGHGPGDVYGDVMQVVARSGDKTLRFSLDAQRYDNISPKDITVRDAVTGLAVDT